MQVVCTNFKRIRALEEATQHTWYISTPYINLHAQGSRDMSELHVQSIKVLLNMLIVSLAWTEGPSRDSL